MPPGRTRLPLGESWVVEGEDDEGHRVGKYEDAEFVADASIQSPPQSSSPARSTRQRTSKRTARSPEPVFIMPSLDPDTMEASWINTGGKATAPPKRTRRADKVQEVRRRSARPNATTPQDSSGNSSPDEPVKDRPLRKTASANRAGPNSVEQVLGHLGTLLSHSLDILGRALSILKTPISYMLAILLLFGIGMVARNLIVSSIYSSLSPVCRIPGVSLLGLPFCPGSGARRGEPAPPIEFEQLMNVQSKFEDILDEAATGVSLPMDMKRSEASIRDLRQLVKYSQLSSRHVLVLEFDGFIDTARIASYDLQKMNSHVGKAVDTVLSTTRWTTQILDDIQTRDVSRGLIGSFLNDRILALFQPTKFTERALLDQYIKHTEIVEQEISKLIVEAQALLMVLTNLEDRLDVIYGVVTQDGEHARAKKEEILSELWTMVGGNRGKLSKMDRQLNLLHHVGVYRRTAYAHVVSTIVRLQAIGAGLEDLRERVGAPEAARDRVYVPLSVHLESIQQGVERLELSRADARRVENEHIRQTLDQSHANLEGTLIGRS
ncbi:MAG: hypothetical protein M1818_002819 [Claussenomyces sp. TS43310]|nr:MAG: hypothetical protein M1818_002819 [Claussenomyces sp. TS43310]